MPRHACMRERLSHGELMRFSVLWTAVRGRKGHWIVVPEGSMTPMSVPRARYWPLGRVSKRATPSETHFVPEIPTSRLATATAPAHQGPRPDENRKLGDRQIIPSTDEKWDKGAAGNGNWHNNHKRKPATRRETRRTRAHTKGTNDKNHTKYCSRKRRKYLDVVSC